MPIVSASSYESQVLAAVATMLSQCASYRALVSAADAAAALSTIIEQVGDPDGGRVRAVDGSAIEFTAPCALLREGDSVSRSAIALRTWSITGSVEIVIMQAYPALREWEALRTARNVAGAIRDELEAQIGDDGCLAEADIAVSAPGLVDAEQPEFGEIATIITIEWQG